MNLYQLIRIPVLQSIEPLQNMIDDLEKIAPPEEDIFTEETSLENLEPIEDLDLESIPVDDIQ